MEIATQQVIGQTYKTGTSSINIPATEWLQIRYGTPDDPTTELQVQCPAGMKWRVNLSVEVYESPA